MSRRRTFVFVGVATAVAAALLLGGRRGVSRLFGPGRPNVLLITIDTLRADHVGSYGYAAATTPVLDALAARGLRFSQATTVVPLTLPAHASLMTGTFPGHHGVRDNGGFYLGDDQTTLAEILREAGWRTGGFVSSFVLDSRWGIHQGFERYFDDFDLSKYEGVGMDSVQRSGDEVVSAALAWLKQDSDKPFFAWAHLYDPHTPYAAPDAYRARYPATLIGAYDAEVAWSDALVGRLLDALRADGRLDETLVVVLGDHGESLGEHKEATHGFFVYDAAIQIPLIMAGPGLPARNVSAQVRIVDVAPTLLELLSLPNSASMQGQSLLPLARGEPVELLAASESWYPRYHYGWSELRSLRDGRYKFIDAPRPELYDLRDDPGEQRDLAVQEADRIEAMRRALLGHAASQTSAAAAKGPGAVDAETEERLQALGYVGGGFSARHLEDRPRGDPKDKIDLYNMLKWAGQFSVEGRLDDAIAKVRLALVEDPEIIEGHMLLGNFHAKAKRYDAAVTAYKEALGLDPEHQGATFSLALAYKNMGRFDDAEVGFERARVLDTRATKPLWQLADTWMRRGQHERAEKALLEAVQRDVEKPTFLVKLGECQIEMKKYTDARRHLEQALALKADVPLGHYNLGLVHEAEGNVASAIASYEAELKREPKAYRSSFNLAKLLLKVGRPRDAVQRFREAVTSEPGFGTGYLYLAKALLDAGDLGGAQAAARDGLAKQPEPKTAPLGHYVLADVFNRLGRTKDADREVAAARRLERGG